MPKRNKGGNGDGAVDSRDAIFSHLRIWQDLDHNGMASTSELHPLLRFGIQGFDLKYTESRRQDSYGNRFRYRGRIFRDPEDDDKAAVNIWDDILLTKAS